MLDNYDNLTLVLAAGIAAVGTATVLLYCWRHYEAAILMILVSPWINWVLYTNIAKTIDEADDTHAASYIRVLIVVLVGLCGIIQFLKYYRDKLTKLPIYLIFLGVFIAFAAVSSAYSIDRKFTTIRSLEFVVFFMFLIGLHCWLGNREKLNRTLNLYFWVTAVGLIVHAAALVLWPSRAWAWNMPNRFQGLADHPNTFGAFCLLAYPILGWKYVTGQRVGKSMAALLMCLTVTMHVLSGSRSSLMASILGGLLWMSCSVRIITLKRIAAGLTFGLLLIFGISFLLLTKPASIKRGDSDVTTLTGRTEFWTGCLQLIREKPLQGYGYGVDGKVWEDPRFQREGEILWVGSVRSSLHNGYLSLAIGLGVIGLALWVLLLSIPVHAVVSLGPSPHRTLILVTIVQLLVLNFVESALDSGSQIQTSLVFWFILILAGRLPAIAGRQPEPMEKSYWETDFGIINSTNSGTGLCPGYTGA